MFQIDLTAAGDLQLHMPNGCAVEISATAEGVGFIKKVLLDHRREITRQPGYIGAFPTQHAVNKFLAEKKQRLAREQAEDLASKASKLGVDLGRLEINL